MHVSARSPRRKALPVVGSVAASLLLTLAGCSSDGGDDDTAASDTRKVKDYFGTVEVPAEPKRIVSADDQTTAALVNLGVTPVASYFTGYAVKPKYLGDALNDIKDISDQERESIVIEDAIALDPDLVITIVGTNGEAWPKEDYYGPFQKIGPTYGWMRDYTSLQGHGDGFIAVGEAIGKADEAKKIFGEVMARADELKARVEKLDEAPTVVLLQVRADGLSTRFWEAVPAIIDALGLEWAVDDSENGGQDISLEQLRLFEKTDAIFTMTDVDAKDTLSSLNDNPIWQGLTPVKDKRAHTIDSAAWLATDPKAIQIMLDDLEKFVIEPAEAKQ